VQVTAFVADNARRVLGVDGARVLAVSARAALAAKLAAAGGNGGGGGGGFFAGLWGARGLELRARDRSSAWRRRRWLPDSAL
jgi:hypothetical protein